MPRPEITAIIRKIQMTNNSTSEMVYEGDWNINLNKGKILTKIYVIPCDFKGKRSVLVPRPIYFLVSVNRSETKLLRFLQR